MTNQLRQSPKNKFNPWYTPGGNAPRFYAQVRVKVTRIKGSRLMDGPKQIGIAGVMKCVKNKIGGLENSVVGYKLMYESAIQFVDAKDLTSGGDIPAEED